MCTLVSSVSLLSLDFVFGQKDEEGVELGEWG